MVFNIIEINEKKLLICKFNTSKLVYNTGNTRIQMLTYIVTEMFKNVLSCHV